MRFNVIYAAKDEPWVSETRKGKVYRPMSIEEPAGNATEALEIAERFAPGDLRVVKVWPVADGEEEGPRVCTQNLVAVMALEQDAEDRKKTLRAIPDDEGRFLNIEEAVEYLGLIIEDYAEEGYHHVNVDQGDKLSDEQVNHLLDGDEDSVREDMWEWEADNAARSVMEYATGHVGDAVSNMVREGVIDDDDADEVEIEFKCISAWDDFYELVSQRDTSDPIMELARLTPDVNVLVLLTEEGPEVLVSMDVADLVSTIRNNWGKNNTNELIDLTSDVVMGEWRVAWDEIARTSNYAGGLKVTTHPIYA